MAPETTALDTILQVFIKTTAGALINECLLTRNGEFALLRKIYKIISHNLYIYMYTHTHTVFGIKTNLSDLLIIKKKSLVEATQTFALGVTDVQPFGSDVSTSPRWVNSQFHCVFSELEAALCALQPVPSLLGI